MTQRVPSDPKLLEAAACLADLHLSEKRISQLVPDVSAFFQLLDALHANDLGETPPAIAFHARWTER